MTLGSGRRQRRASASAVSALAVVVALAGCSLLADFGGAPSGQGTTAPTPAQSGEPSPAPEEIEPTLVPDGDAADNLPLFAAVVEEVWESDSRAQGRAYIDALSDAGFDKDAMQVTEDRTTVGNAAESIQFSVRWGDEECLIGQVGPSTGDPVTTVMDQLADDRCLVGTTRTIDW